MESIRSNRPPLFGFRWLRGVQFPHNVSCLLQELDHLVMIHSRAGPDLGQVHCSHGSRWFIISFVVREQQVMDQCSYLSRKRDDCLFNPFRARIRRKNCFSRFDLPLAIP